MKSLRVLVLVGSSDRRNQLVALLRSADHQVDAVPDAASAAESLREPMFDTLVIDLNAPDLDLSVLRQAISRSDYIEPESLDAAERRHLAQVLRHTAGNKRKAAQLLGIARSTLLNKVRKYGLEER
jgi:DNA-binding NtrC family response regulator